MADVTFKHSDFSKMLPDWNLVGDVCEGERAVKAKKETYLPKPNPNDKSEDNRRRFESYLERAVFYNATGRTLEGLVGAVFRKDPVVEVPPSVSYIEDDVDGAGVSIYQQAQKALHEVLQKGRFALYVDYPTGQGNASLLDHMKGAVRATINGVEAGRVINWRVEKYGAVMRLALVVIQETEQVVTEDGFGVEDVEQFRVLRLIENVYVVEVWRQDKNSKFHKVEEYVPLDGTAKPWNEIPFIFIGSKNNDPDVDKPPLLDLARLNIAHYRNSADYEDSAFFVGQAQPWISGLDTEWRDHLEKNGIYIGARSPILLPEGGQFGFAQAGPNTLAKEAMDAKERQMVALGARLIERGQAVKTATEAQSENEAEHSVLSLVAGNVSEAYSRALAWLCRFMKQPEDAVTFELNKDFVEATLNPQMLTALIAAWQSGKLPSSDLWNQFKKYGLIASEKTEEEIQSELDGEEAGLGLEDG